MTDYDRSKAKCLCPRPAPFVTDDLSWLCSVCGCGVEKPTLTSPNKSHLDGVAGVPVTTPGDQTRELRLPGGGTLITSTPGTENNWVKDQVLDEDPSSRPQWAKEHIHQWPEHLGSTEESTTFWPNRLGGTDEKPEPCSKAVIRYPEDDMFNENERLFAFDPFTVPLISAEELPSMYSEYTPVKVGTTSTPRPPRSVSYPYLQVAREHGVRYGAVLDFVERLERGEAPMFVAREPWEQSAVDAWAQEYGRRLKLRLMSMEPRRQGKSIVRKLFGWLNP